MHRMHHRLKEVDRKFITQETTEIDNDRTLEELKSTSFY